HDDDLVGVARLRPQLEAKPLRPAFDDPNGRLYARNVAARFTAELVEAVGQVPEVGRSVSTRRHVPGLTASRFRGYRYAGQRSCSHGVDDVDRDSACACETGWQDEEQRQPPAMPNGMSHTTTRHVPSTC